MDLKDSDEGIHSQLMDFTKQYNNAIADLGNNYNNQSSRKKARIMAKKARKNDELDFYSKRIYK